MCERVKVERNERFSGDTSVPSRFIAAPDEGRCRPTTAQQGRSLQVSTDTSDLPVVTIVPLWPILVSNTVA